MKKKTDHEIKIEHYQNLVAVAMADGFLDDNEYDFLLERAEEIDLPIDEVKKLLDKADELTFLIPFNTAESEEQLADIVYIMMVDGNIDDKEYQLCLNIAKKLELGQKELDYVIQLTKELWEKA